MSLDLDDDLLALAGDDVEEDAEDEVEEGEEEEDAKPSPSLSPPPMPAATRSPEPSSPKKRPRPPPARKSRKKARRDSSSDEEQDDDELKNSNDDDSFNEAASSHSDADDAPMDLASGSEEEGEDIKELYPLDGKYKDMADKEKLLAMTEVEREAVLAERAALLEREHLDRQLRNLLKSRKDEAAGLRKSARTKSAPTKTAEVSKREKLDELRRTKQARDGRKAQGGKMSVGDEDASKPFLDVDDDGGYDDGYVKEERELELADMNRAKIGRTGLGKLCDYPGFEETVQDCFVRLSLFDRESQKSVYRVAQIKGFTVGKPYTMLDGTRRTDQHLHLCQGKAERNFPMDMMSDGKVTESEFYRFKKQCEVDKIPLPTPSFLEHKHQQLKKLDSKILSVPEVDAIIKKRNAGKIDSVQLVLQRSSLKEARARAVLAENEEEIRRIDRELQELEDRQNVRPVGRQETQMERMARINAENRRRNQEEIRRAEIEEKRAARAAAKAAAKGDGGAINPFMRVKTVVKFRHDMKSTKDSAPTTGDNTRSVTPVKKDDEKNGVGVMNNIPIPVGRRKGGIDDVIASMDIDIEI